MEDYRVIFGGIEEIGKHLNEGLTLYLVLRGEVDCELRGASVRLPQDSCVLLSDGDVYGMTGSRANVLLGVTFRQSYIDQECPEALGCRFFCCSAMAGEEGPPPRAYSRLKQHIARLVFLHTERRQGWQFAFRAEFQRMMECLYLYFQRGKMPALPDSGDEGRVQSILTYIRRNYRFRISARDIAEREFISPQYLSKLFRKKTGSTMTAYLARLRVESSVSELLDTDHTVLQVALNNGFPNEKAFAAQFREICGENPASYRRTHRRQQWKSEKWRYLLKDAEPQPLSALSQYLLRYEDESERPAVIEKELSLGAGGALFPSSRRRILLAGDFGSVTRRETLGQLEEVQRHLRFDTVCLSGFLSGSSETMSHGEYLKYGEYYEVFDTLAELRLTPWLQISCRELEDASLFASPEEALKRLKLLLELALQKYGRRHCARWCFELCGPAEEAAKRFPALRDCVHSVIPEAKLGMPVPFSSREPLPDAGLFCRLAQTAPPDFVSLCFDQNEEKGRAGFGTPGFFRDCMARRLSALKAFMAAAGLPRLKYCLLDSNTLTGASTIEAGEYHRSALIAEQAMDAAELMDGTGISLNLSCRPAGKEERLVTYGLSLFLQKRIRRTPFYIYQMIQSCRGRLVSRSDCHVLTERGEGSYALLLFRPVYLETSDSLDKMLTGRYETTFRVTLRGLPPGRYRIRRMVLDKSRGSIYNALTSVDQHIPLSVGGIDEYFAHHVFPEVAMSDETLGSVADFSQGSTLNALILYTFERLPDLSQDLPN